LIPISSKALEWVTAWDLERALAWDLAWDLAWVKALALEWDLERVLAWVKALALEWVKFLPVADRNRAIRGLRNSSNIIAECGSPPFLMWEGQPLPQFSYPPNL